MNSTHEIGCIVCGARRSGERPTCDGICARAWGSGRTRPQQIKADLRREDETYTELLCDEELRKELAWEIYEETHYNNPECN